MSESPATTIREAREEDVPGIQAVFEEVYGGDYPYRGFFDTHWLKRSIWGDDMLMLVAEQADGRIVGTAGVVFDIGAHSDLIGEFGRLAVHPEARGQGLGRRLMEARVDFIRPRLHVGIVENRAVHPYSQKISNAYGFAPAGFLPLKHEFLSRESIALFVNHFGNALALRNNHPRLVPEAHALAHAVLDGCNLPYDVIVDEEAKAYPPADPAFELEQLTAEGLPSLLRIARGRIRNREVFGPMRAHYGFFKLKAKQASYLIARQAAGGVSGRGAVAAAVGYIHDEIEHTLRIFELIVRDDSAARLVLEALLSRCPSMGVKYAEVDVSAYAPRMQRTFLELGFLPVGYVPAMVFHDVERLDVLRMARLWAPLDLGPLELIPRMQALAELVIRGFVQQAVLPELAAAIPALSVFRGLDEEQAARVAGQCSLLTLAPGESLFAVGAPGDALFLVLAGEVEIQLSGRRLGQVGQGECLGELSLLAGEPHSASARANPGQPARVARLDKKDLNRLTRQRTDIGVALYRNLAVSLGRKLSRLDQSLVNDSAEQPGLS